MHGHSWPRAKAVISASAATRTRAVWRLRSSRRLGRWRSRNLDIEDPHPLIVDCCRSLKDAAQSQFYEPSDWQFARFTLHFANKLIHSNRPSSQMIAAVNATLTELLVGEGARRRVRLEIEREQTTATIIDVAEMFRQQMT
jgi:hypothetical protein